jgi:dTDP-4-dehydrorhamnose reductase
MNILLLGSTGQVGSALVLLLKPACNLTAATRQDADFENLEKLALYIRSARPDVIINSAAYTAVDRAESEPALAYLVNAAAPEVVAIEAEKLGARLIHYSTDYVFQGDGDTPWGEVDTPKPLSIYGKTKLEGEQKILKACSSAFILRTSWVYSAGNSNFLKSILKAALKRQTLEVVDDQIGSPTGADLIASMTQKIIETRAAIEPGIYHLAASGYVSWFDYAERIIAHAKRLEPDAWAVRSIMPIKSDSLASPAPRPLNSRLDTKKLQAALHCSVPAWHEGVDATVRKVLKDGLL